MRDWTGHARVIRPIEIRFPQFTPWVATPGSWNAPLLGSTDKVMGRCAAKLGCDLVQAPNHIASKRPDYGFFRRFESQIGSSKFIHWHIWLFQEVAHGLLYFWIYFFEELVIRNFLHVIFFNIQQAVLLFQIFILRLEHLANFISVFGHFFSDFDLFGVDDLLLVFRYLFFIGGVCPGVLH